MNLVRVANNTVFRKIRQLETLAKPGGLLVRSCNPTQHPRLASSLTNLNRCVIPNMNNYAKCRILSKLPAQSAVSVIPTRAAGNVHNDHVRLWVMERLVSVALLTLVPCALILENQLLDAIMAATVIMHAHWGLEAVIIDYARPIVVGSAFAKIAMFSLYLISATTLAGLLVLIYNGPGLSKVIKQGWAIGKEERKE